MIKDKRHTAEFLESVLRDVFKALGQQVEIKRHNVDCDDDLESVEIDGWLWAYPTMVHREIETIHGKGKVLRNGFTIGRTVRTPATRWEPEDQEPVEFAQEIGPWDTVHRMLTEYFENLINGAMEGVEITQHLKEEAEIAKEIGKHKFQADHE